MSSRFTLDDFRKQMALIAKSGLAQRVLDTLPTYSPLRSAMDDFGKTDINGQIGIIDSMTPGERSDSSIIDQSREHRIADGAGCEPRQVRELVQHSEWMAEVVVPLATRQRREMPDDRKSGFRELRRPVVDDDEYEPPPDKPPPPLLA